MNLMSSEPAEGGGLERVSAAGADAAATGAGAGAAEYAVVSFLGQLLRVHLGRWSNPQFGWQIALALQQLRRGAEVADVGHA